MLAGSEWDCADSGVGGRRPAGSAGGGPGEAAVPGPGTGPAVGVGPPPSMGRRGDAYDNALCEAFFATLERKVLDRYRFQTREGARSAVFTYLGGTSVGTGTQLSTCRPGSSRGGGPDTNLSALHPPRKRGRSTSGSRPRAESGSSGTRWCRTRPFPTSRASARPPSAQMTPTGAHAEIRWSAPAGLRDVLHPSVRANGPGEGMGYGGEGTAPPADGHRETAVALGAARTGVGGRGAAGAGEVTMAGRTPARHQTIAWKLKEAEYGG